MNRRAYLATGASAAALVAGCSLGDAGVDRTCSVDPTRNPGTAGWPTATGDWRNTRSVLRAAMPEPPLSVGWTHAVGGHIGIPAPTVADGTVYTTDMDATLYAVGAEEGQTRWSASVADPGLPVVAGDAVALGADDGHFGAVERADGRERWTAALPTAGRFPYRRPTVAAGAVVVPTRLGLAAFDRASGEVRWRYRTGLSTASHPVVADGTVYVGGADAYVHAVDAATGERRWWTETAASVETPVAVAGGAAYAGTVEGTVLSLDAASGEVRWRREVDDRPERLAVDGGHVYVGTAGGLVALRADSGERCWRYGGFTPSYAGGLAASPDRVFATDTGSDGDIPRTLVALDPSSGEVAWRFYGAADRLSSGPAVVDGAIYVGGVVEGTLSLIELS
ncbi:PQQ-binding-like beta-propeller repeat protein [Halosimplex litoreum]|uniref:PQQ-binding-like beta-propeller repeat protein n=1 Tax=Halosimplex litoreum TaxID=1198301 RepID=A0A7T3G0C9_9EURY|nr:PQQ-binding-like beta-propeller repeat protein [Halosimplex litoreum]QPV64054.1 PQQ-binding-like beta-propeller repeat protein [Halosimplex litoreum]